jgi:hypothetical protein
VDAGVEAKSGAQESLMLVGRGFHLGPVIATGNHGPRVRFKHG